MRGSIKCAESAELVLCAEAVPVVANIPAKRARQERMVANAIFIEVNRRIWFFSLSKSGELVRGIYPLQVSIFNISINIGCTWFQVR